jgi:hypothetical protein
MSLRRRLAAVALAAALADCAAPATSRTAATAPAATKPAAPIESRISPRFIGLVGPKLAHDPPFLGVAATNFYTLRSLLDRATGESVTQLYVSDSYFGAERGWDGAHDAAGRKLRFNHISTDRIACDGGCAYAEEFAATLPEAVLHADEAEVSITFTARSGATMTIRLSRPLIAAQLAAIEAARRRPPAAASP